MCTIWPRGLRGESAAFGCLDCGFESRRGHGCLSVVSVVFCQLEVSATS